MKIYKPKCSLGTLSAPQSELKSKFGGNPWGFPEEKWPSADLVLLAQLVHEPPMIDLGGDFVLHLWHWADPDSFMDPPNYEQGSVFSTLLKRDEIGSGPTPAPRKGPLLGEVFIDGWDVLDDGVPPEWEEKYYSESGCLEVLNAETKEIRTGNGLRTRFGGFPSWDGTGGLYELPDNLTFLFQTDGSFSTEGNLSDFSNAGSVLCKQGSCTGIQSQPNAPQMISEYRDRIVVRFADFASDGVAFVFLDKSGEVPIVRWTWSR